MKKGKKFELTSEYVIAGILIEGKNIAAKILDISSDGKVNVLSIAEALSI